MYYINIDWLNNLNLKEPTTLDELYNVLVAFRDNDPDKNNINDTIPMSGQHGVSGNDSSLLIINAMGYVNSRIDVIDDKVVFVPNEDNYKHALEYMNKLFVEKLLDQEYFTQSPESYIANIDSLKYGLYYLKRQPTGKNVDGKYITQYKTFAPLTSEYNSVKTIGLSSGITSGAFVITSKCKYPEAMIRWADFLFSEEGTVMGRFGPVFDSWEGQTGIRWKTTDDGKKYWEPVMPKDFTAPYYEYRGKFLIPLGIPWFIDEKIHNYQMAGDPLQSTTKKNVLDNTMQYSRQGFPKTYFSDVEQEDVNSLQTDIFTYVNQMEANFIIGRESLEKWDDYINTLKAMGVDELIMIYQTAYQRWIDAN
jgi:putative aldouronate transport system substrate-binding protein